MDKNLQKLISLKIKNLREKRGLNQESFSEIANIDITTVSNIENGKTFPSFYTICKIMQAFELEPNSFLDFINYDNDSDATLDRLILERLNRTPKDIKEKILDLLEVINRK